MATEVHIKYMEIVDIGHLTQGYHNVLSYDITPAAYLQCHMSIMAAQMTGNLTVVQQIVEANNKENINAPHYWPFMRRNYR